MRMRIITTIVQPFKIVYQGFNKQLFLYLLPPFVARLNKYEGQNPGDIVDIKFTIPIIGNWTVIIKESWLSHREYGFVDRGLRVPFGIRYWKHIHRVVARDASSCFIVDDIEFESPSRIWDRLMYIPLFLMFYPRKFQYKKYFRKISRAE